MTEYARNRFARSIAVATALCLVLIGGGAAAEDAAAFYKDKTVRFFTMGGPGGGFDIYMRSMIPYLEKRMGAKFMPVNESAAGGLVAMNKTAGAPADGLTILLTFGEAAVGGELYAVSGARYDVRKLAWIARVGTTPKVVLFGPKTPYKTFAEAMKAGGPLIWGGTGKTDGNTDFAAILSHTLGMKAKMVIGYKGSRGMLMAVEQGETSAQVLSDESGFRASQRGPIRAVATLDHQRSKYFPDVPTVFELLGDRKPKDLWMVDWRAKVSATGRVLVTTPGTPKDRVAFLREKVRETLRDPGFLAEAKKRKLTIDYASGEVGEKLVEETMGKIDKRRIDAIKQTTLKEFYEH